MTDNTIRKDAILPWEKSPDRTGYTKLDLHLDLGEHGRVDVRRQKPNEDNPGKFTAYLNGQPVTNRAYFMRHEAVAEAERILYTSDQFRTSKPATILNAQIQQGRDAFMEGTSVFACPIGADKPVSREHWLAGWMEAFANSVLAPLKEGITQTTRAYNQLASDADYNNGLLTSYRTILAFANGIEEVDRLRRFLTLANAGDLATIRTEFPGLLPAVPSPASPDDTAAENVGG